MTAAPPVPGRTLRIAVTGTRQTMPSHVARQVSELLALIVTLTPDSKDGPTRRYVISPLAEGADRLVANCALDQGFDLVCPLPFPRDAYARDFESDASKAEFDRLLRRAEGRVLELDSRRPPEKPVGDAEKARRQAEDSNAYEAVGRLVVRNCDLIVGIWDGGPGHGRGGTAEIIRYAANNGPPVVWIDATSHVPPRWIEEAHDLRIGASPRQPVEMLLPIYLNRLLQPPDPPHPKRSSLLHKVAHYFVASVNAVWRWVTKRPPPDPLTTFLNEKPRRDRVLWRLNTGFMILMNWCPFNQHRHVSQLYARPEDQPARSWYDRYVLADARSNEYTARYRSAYVLIFILAIIAVTTAAVEPELPQGHFQTAILIAEFFSLAAILLLVITGGLRGWHRKAIEYRLVAELCRKQQALAPIGWTVPRAIAWATTGKPDPSTPKKPKNWLSRTWTVIGKRLGWNRHKPQIEPVAWVSWLFSAWLRDTPLPTRAMEMIRVETAKNAALHDLLDDQIAYHQRRRDRSERPGARLIWLGEGVFITVLLLVAMKLFCPIWDHEFADGHSPAFRTHLLGLAIAILPAFSAAFVGIRAYAELELLAEQSELMLHALTRARDQIKELPSDTSLASQVLGSALAGVATVMLEDLEGWARLFRGKALDA